MFVILRLIEKCMPYMHVSLKQKRDEQACNEKCYSTACRYAKTAITSIMHDYFYKGGFGSGDFPHRRLTLGVDDPGAHHVAFVAHEDDGVVPDEALPPEEAERVLGGLEARSVRDGVDHHTRVGSVSGESVLGLPTSEQNRT